MNTLQTSETLLSRKSTRDKRNKLQKQAEADRPYFDKLEEHSESSLDLVLDEIDGKGKGVRVSNRRSDNMQIESETYLGWESVQCWKFRG